MHLAIHWRSDSLLRFFAMLLLCLWIGGIAGFWLQRAIDDGLPLDKKTGVILINIVFLNLGWFGVIWMLLKEHQIQWKEAFGFSTHRLGVILVHGFLTAILGCCMVFILGNLLKHGLEVMGIEVATQEIVDTFQNAEHVYQRVLIGITAVVLAPCIEELLFRGVIFTAMRQHLPRVIALLGSSFIFGLVHANKLSLIPLTCLALLFARLYEKTGNLWAPIFAHAAFNSINLGFMLLSSELNSSNMP
ncbi:MAG: CPBP family intramembrane metalloprotease [Verrucomicrobiota bacterium]|nr:CPBP family intramembrane metalloprotease [Verrucomicrobiota bacterium]